ncbi:MAG: DsrH/TusB family sulfur metabolism protein [Pseudomonadota bacterium]
MSTLFCLTNVHDSNCLNELDGYLNPSDSVLLIDYALELAVSDEALLYRWAQRSVTVFRLMTGDCADDPLSQSVIQSVDYDGWVSLAERHANQLWWR